MSDNYRLYQQKMSEQKAERDSESQPLRDQLRDQLEELYDVVRWCERIWSIEDRIERSR
jgi:hypothetical protein